MVGGIPRRRGEKLLNDREIRAWVRQNEAAQGYGKLFDGGGLYLQLTAPPARRPVWRVKYRFAGAEKTISLGGFPDVGLSEARAQLAGARELLRAGRDPVHDRRLEKAAALASAGNTFAAVKEAWLEKKRPTWSGSHYDTTSETLQRYSRTLDRFPVATITPAMVSAAVDYVVEQRESIDTAKKLYTSLRKIFRFAVARGLCAPPGPAETQSELIPRRQITGRRPALLTWPELGRLLKAARLANLSRAVHMAHRLCAFTAARMGNVIAAEWPEFELDVDPPRWVIPRAKMKMRDRLHDHTVTLGPSIAAELTEWRALTGGRGYVFPALPPADAGSHITHESIEKAYRVTLKLSGKHTPHGWRAAFATLAKDAGFDRDAVEMALDHVHDNEVVRAYDRGERRQTRIKLAKWWCERLVEAERGAP